MAGKTVGWAFDQQIKNPTHKFVLVALADITDDHGVCWPKYNYLSNKTGLAKRTIAGAIKALCEANLIIKAQRTNDNGGNMSNAYRLASHSGSLKGHPLQIWFDDLGAHDNQTRDAADAPPPCTKNTTPVQEMHDPHAGDVSLYIEDTPLIPQYNNIYKNSACARDQFLRGVSKAFKIGAFEKEFGHLTESELHRAAEECFELWRDRLIGRDEVIILRIWLRNGVKMGSIRKASKAEKAEQAPKREHKNDRQPWHDRIEPLVKPAVFQTWIRPMIHDEGQGALIAPSKYHAEYVENNFRSEIDRALFGAVITHQALIHQERKEIA